MHRRHFLSSAGAAGVAAAVGIPLAVNKFSDTTASAPIEPLLDSGADLAGWVTTLGDTSQTAPDRRPRRTDVARLDHGSHSELVANTQARGVMAQAHASKRFSVLPTAAERHDAIIEFRLPDRAPTGRGNNVGQAIEAGLFVQDPDDRAVDRGVAIQWVLNPWVETYGDVRMCAETNRGIEWRTVAHLEPDNEWHTFAMCFAPGSRRTRVKLDGQVLPADKAIAVRHDVGGNFQGRLQVKTQSVWPGNHQSMPPFRAEFRNWRWRSS